MDALHSSAVPAAERPSYARHRPEQSLLYQLIERYYPLLVAQLGAAGRTLPRHVQREFADYLKCGRLEHGFLRLRCEQCEAERLLAFSCKRRGFCPSCAGRRMADTAALLVEEVLPRVPIRQWVLSVPHGLRYLFARDPQALSAALSVVYRCIAAYQRRRAGLRRGEADSGAVTLIQRFGGALNLNVHFHMLVPDGVYVRTATGPAFRELAAPQSGELQELVERMAVRIGRQLERRGILVRDAESSYVEAGAQSEEDGLAELQGASITYRIALGAQRGRKVMLLQTVLPSLQERYGESAAQSSGFSLHAGVAAEAEEREKLERLCRYISRPAIATERLSMTGQGQVRYALKRAYRDGTTHVVLDPVDFVARLAALVPSPGVNLTRFHGVFAPHHGWRARIVPGRRAGRQGSQECAAGCRGTAMGWARRLQRVFGVDAQQCEECGGRVRIVSCIEDEQIIEKILRHLGLWEEGAGQALARAGPQARSLLE